MKMTINPDQGTLLKGLLEKEIKQIQIELSRLDDSSEHAYVNEGYLFVVMNERKKLEANQQACQDLLDQLNSL